MKRVEPPLAIMKEVSYLTLIHMVDVCTPVIFLAKFTPIVELDRGKPVIVSVARSLNPKRAVLKIGMTTHGSKESIKKDTLNQ